MSCSSPTGRLLVGEPAPGVTRLTISHPGKRGALDHTILDALAATLPRLDTRCVILTGEGRTFSAGYDLGTLSAEALAEEAAELVAHPFAAAIDAVAAHPAPTLAVLNGAAIGGGLELAVACDLRIATTPAKLGMPPAKLGLVYSHTGIRKFIETIGAPRTRELFLVGELIDAATALSWGLVGSVVAPDELSERALVLAATIAANAPLAQTGNKRVINAVLDAQAAIAPAVVRELLELREASFGTEDFREGVRAFEDKRDPDFRGR